MTARRPVENRERIGKHGDAFYSGKFAFIDFLRGRLGLVGARALTPEQYGKLPIYLKKFYDQFKPGWLCIEMMYKQLPEKGIEKDGIYLRYFEARKWKPKRTQARYFWKILLAVIFRKTH